MASMPQDFNFFGHFVLMVSFEILSCYPNVDGVPIVSEKTFNEK